MLSSPRVLLRTPSEAGLAMGRPQLKRHSALEPLRPAPCWLCEPLPSQALIKQCRLAGLLGGCVHTCVHLHSLVHP